MSAVKNKVTAKATGLATNPTKKSLVKVVVFDDKGKWISPEKQSTHYISDDAVLPGVTFEIETDQSAPFEWSWKISWDAKTSGVRESANRGKLVKTFEQSGSIKNDSKKWQMDFGGKVLGGVLTVTVRAGVEEFKRSIFIKGKNPSSAKIKEFADSLGGVKGFDKILMHEALGKNFINADGEPVVAGDKGFGITQATNPAPAYEQIWSWKENIKVGSTLYRDYYDRATKLLSKHPPYTEEMVINQAYGLWNGGGYYKFDATDGTWKQIIDTLTCDTVVANIGWNMEREANKDKDVAELHERDKESFKKGRSGQSDEHRWVYTGICYADSVSKK